MQSQNTSPDSKDVLEEGVRHISLGRFPINLSKTIMANFGWTELYHDKIVISDPSVNTIQDVSGPTRIVKLDKINSIKLKTWLLFNAKIIIDYTNGIEHRETTFSFGDTWSTNMFKTIYLYKALLNLKKMVFVTRFY